MTTRTVKIFGLAYGSTPAEIAVTLDGVSVYTGTVTTADTPTPSMPNPDLTNTTIEFCSFEIPMDFEGTKSMTCAVTNGTVIFAQVVANYCVIANTDPVAGTGPEVFVHINGSNDARSNVAIDGVAQSMNHEELAGTWWFTIPDGSTLTYDLSIQAGTANVAP
jgi:streptogramin lyase